jgi:RHH-type proline utilization regulon transcriptional repressor/proline dehydrogenase/delta 1-pyrroline-5-carboxylate dehydrogenase
MRNGTTAPPGRGNGGRFFAPLAVEIDSLDAMKREVFGPVVHVLPYRARDSMRWWRA